MKRKNEIIVFSLIATLVVSILGVFTLVIIKLSGNISISLPNFDSISEIFSKDDEVWDNSDFKLEPIEVKYDEVKYYLYQ